MRKTPSIQTMDRLVASASEGGRRAAEAIVRLQRPGGFWQAILTGGDVTLEADFILLQLWLHPPRDGVWNPPNRARIERAVSSILERQLPDGGFNTYPKGPADVSASVKAYFAMKLAGIPPDDPRLARCREKILLLGGIQSCNSYVKINLSLFGLYPREYCPTVPPEIMLLPGNFIYQMSSWTRAIVIPLSILHSSGVTRPALRGFTLQELYRPDLPLTYRKDSRLLTWRNLFLGLDRVLKFWERHGSRRLRAKAIQRALEWSLDHTSHSEGLAAIYPPMMYLLMVLDLLGYAPDHPDRVEAQKQFDALMVDDGQRLFFQPCFSPVWDTAIAMWALGVSGLAPAGVMRRAADWILSKEVRRRGDWSIKRPNLEPAGWYFEFANEFYPDIDDTAFVLLGLKHARATDSGAQQAAERRAINWLLGMQSKDGGWAAFDVDNDCTILSYVPFADHNAMLDPSCPDITGHVLEALGACGLDRRHAAIRKGIRYLTRAQRPDGSWYGRWGVNFLYGTSAALCGLSATGESSQASHIFRGAEWLRSIQNGDGGWGESCMSYDAGEFVPAPSTPSQTAWALLGLLASGDTASHCLRKGIEYLVETQRLEGTWDEDLATGTGFPRVYYLIYHFYRDLFPLLALSRFLESQEGGTASVPPGAKPLGKFREKSAPPPEAARKLDEHDRHEKPHS